MEWISIEDKLPEGGQRVLAFGDFSGELNNGDGDCVGVYSCDYEGKNYWAADGHYYGTWIDNVSHWMPLPEPPTKKT